MIVLHACDDGAGSCAKAPDDEELILVVEADAPSEGAHFDCSCQYDDKAWCREISGEGCYFRTWAFSADVEYIAPIVIDAISDSTFTLMDEELEILTSCGSTDTATEEAR